MKFGQVFRPQGFSDTWCKPGENLVKFRNLGEHGNNFEKNVFFGFGEKRFLQSGPKMVWSKRVFVLRT